MMWNHSSFLSENTDKVSYKKHLRTELKPLRARLRLEREADLILNVERFLGALDGVRILGIYSAVGSEPNIVAAAEKWAEECGGALALPFVLNTKERVMEYRLSYEAGRRRHPVVKDAAAMKASVGPVASPDLILVPCLGFSATGRRLGYGGGFFDAYLSVRSAAAVGIAYKALLVDDEIFEEHDRPLKEVITEFGPFGVKRFT